MKKLLFAAALLWLTYGNSSSAAIATDAFDTASPGSATSSITKSFTVGTGHNRGLYVFVKTGNIVVDSVTWNGTALTAISGSLINDVTYGYRLQWFRLENPASGTHDLVVNLASSGWPLVFIHSYSGVAQSGQPDASAVSSQTFQSTTYATSITTASSNSWVLAGTFTEYSDQAISSAGMTQRNATNNAYTWDSNGPQAAGNYSTGDFSTSPYGRRWFVSMIAIKPAKGIVEDAFDTVDPGSVTSSITKSFTVGTANNRGLYIFVRTNNIEVSSVTWNGTALAAVSGSLINDVTYGHRLQWFHLSNPDSGTHDLVVNLASSGWALVFIHSYSGVSQSGQPDASASSVQTTQSTTYATSITTVTDNSWVLAGTFTEYSDQAISSAGMTQRNTTNNAYTWDSNGPQAVGNYSTGNFSTSPFGRRWFVSMIAIKPEKIAPDAFEVVSPSSATSSVTESVTLGSGDDRGLYVLVRTSTVSVSSVRWNGTALSAVAGSAINDSTNNIHLKWFHLEGPDSGTHDLVVDLSSSDDCAIFIHSYTGVAQSGQPDVAATSTQATNSSTFSPSITTVTDGALILAGIRANYADQDGDGYEFTFDSGGPKDPAGNYTGQFSSALNVTSSNMTQRTQTSFARKWYASMIAINRS